MMPCCALDENVVLDPAFPPAAALSSAAVGTFSNTTSLGSFSSLLKDPERRAGVADIAARTLAR